MKDTRIEWPHHTFNPWHGCFKVSEGCANCYAAALDNRTQAVTHWGKTAPRRFFGVEHWSQPVKWNEEAKKAGERRRVFCASMADVFEIRQDLAAPRRDLFNLIEATPWLDWLLLTKRPENMVWLLPEEWLAAPRPNVWLGTSVENRKAAEERIPELLDTPAVVRFLSMEPLIEGFRLWDLPCGERFDSEGAPYYNPIQGFSFWSDGDFGHRGPCIDWVIVGGESGGKARPMNPQWVRDIEQQCHPPFERTRRAAFFFKQWGEWLPEGQTDNDELQAAMMAGRFNLEQQWWDFEQGPEPVHIATSHRVGKKMAGRLLDGRTWDELPNVSEMTPEVLLGAEVAQ